MKRHRSSRKTLSLFTLFAAGTLAPFALADDAETREKHDVADEAALRKYLSEEKSRETVKDENGKETTKIHYFDNADLTLANDFAVDTNLKKTTDEDGKETISRTSIVVNANGSAILGAGKTITTTGESDLFFLEEGISLSVENVKISADENSQNSAAGTGRVFTTGNASFSAAIAVGAGTTVENRFLKIYDAETLPNYSAKGGALVSAHILDKISLENAIGGNIVFSGNRVENSLAEDGETKSDLTAGGGAIFASGELSVSGAGTTRFEKNSAISENAEAQGGAIFISNAKLNADGSAGTTTYPDSVVEGAENMKFGLQVAKTTLEFSENSATGRVAQGGAVFVSGGYFQTNAAKISFAENAAENDDSAAAETMIGGGALVICDGGKAEFDARTTLEFSQNSATGNSSLGKIGGGALSVSEATFSLAGTTRFEKNSATAKAAGTSVYGGAAYFSGSVKTDEKDKEVFTTNVTLAGTLNFSENSSKAEALAGKKTTGTGDDEKTEIFESSATGGAIAIYGAKIDGTELSALNFSANSAAAKTFAQGGALALIAGNSDSGKILAALKTSGEFSFAKNSATLLALENDETQTENVSAAARGGAIFLENSAGTLELASAGTLNFSENAANASAQENAFAQGGAIFQSTGTLALGASDFEKNSAAAEMSAGTAQGGAAHFSGGETKFSGAKKFAENSATGAIAQGGAIFSAGGKQNFDAATTFSENSARAGTENSSAGNTFARGGAIFATNAGTETFGAKTTFSENSATAISADGTNADGKKSGAAGGAIFSAGTLTFAEANFAKNSASVSGDENGAAFGGAIYLNGGNFSATKISATENSVSAAGETRGGAVYVSAGTLDVSRDFSLSENKISGAKTAAGGAIFSAETIRVGGNFSATQNSAEASGEVRGGAISVSAGTFSVNGDGAHAISGNAAQSTGGDVYGGAIFSKASFATTAGTLEISGNSAKANGGNAFGGAIFVGGGNLELTNAQLTNNSATGTLAHGGAIFVDVSQSASNLVFRGNTAISGNTANGENDGIFIGGNAGTDAKNTATLTFDANAKVETDDDGNTTVPDAETATVADKISVADKATLVLRKTGAGNLTLSEISVEDGAQLNLEIAGGNAKFGGSVGDVAKLSVEKGAAMEIAGTFSGFSEAEIAGTLNVAGTGKFAFADGSKMTLAGTFAFAENSEATIAGATAIAGAGTFSVAGNVKFSGAGDGAELTAQTLSVGAGTLTLDALALNVSDKLIFTESGEAEIVLSDNATLALKNIARTADGVNVKISGAGKIIVYADATDGKDEDSSADEKISFAAFFEKIKDENGKETEVLRAGSFVVENSVSVDAGISVGTGVTLALDFASQTAETKNIWLEGGKLVAAGTSAETPFALKKFDVSGDAKSVLGDGETEQFFAMVEVIDDKGEAKTNALALKGDLEIAEKTTFVGDVAMTRNSELSGAGTVKGTISGTGTLSLANVVGAISVKNGSTLTLAGTVNLDGDATVGAENQGSANANFIFANGANFSAKNFNNYANVRAGTASFSGNFVNAGTLKIDENSTLTFTENSTFSSREKSVIDISAANSAIDFSQATVENIGAGTVKIDATKISAGANLQIIGLSAEEYESLTLVDVNRYDLDERFVWDSVSGTLKFLGLNGENFRGTLYGDLQRENLNRTFDLMHAALLRAGTRTLTPQLFGKNKLESPYMRGYIERQNQRGGDVSAEAKAREKAELALAEKLNSPLKNLWVQGDFSSQRHRSRDGFGAYDTDVFGALFGVSAKLAAWEVGGVLSVGEEKYKTDSSSGTRHKVNTDAYGIAAYAGRNFWETTGDWTIGAAGMLGNSDSERGDFSGNFDRWQMGLMTEIGLTLRTQNWLALRIFAGADAAYARTSAFDESGGDGALSVDSGSAFGARARLGFSSAIAATDTLQFTLRCAGVMDLGKSTFELDATIPSTRTHYVIESRENENLGLEAGAYFNWILGDSCSVFGGFTGTVRAGENAQTFSLGVSYFF